MVRKVRHRVDSAKSDRRPTAVGDDAGAAVALTQGKTAGLTLRGVASSLGLSVGVVRSHVKAGRLAASRAAGAHGPEYRVCPAVMTAFAAERPELGAAPGNDLHVPTTVADPEIHELRLRLQVALDEAERCKSLSAAQAEHHRVEVARLQQERDAALLRANQAAAELEHLRRRGFLGRLFDT